MMDRRSMLKATGVAVATAIGAVALPSASSASEGAPLKGVGVLRYPPGTCRTQDGREVDAVEVAHQLIAEIRPGSILAMSSDKDEHGHYLWDFRIEGGDTRQVRVERTGG